MHDHGLFCDACGTVTLFEPESMYPRSCGRCDAVLRDAPRPDTRRALRRERERAALARRAAREAREARAARRAA
jgi:hypothetical protein